MTTEEVELTANSVYVVWHTHIIEDHRRDAGDPGGDVGEDSKILGIFVSREEAETRITRARGTPGFCDAPNGFTVDEYVVGEDHWTEGFTTT